MAGEKSNPLDPTDQSSPKFGTNILGGQVGNVFNAAGNVVVHQPAPYTGVLALHQLPPPPADFTGREAELDDLFARIKTGGVNISGLRGMGGIGKTALALTLAHRLKQYYPDAQFFLDLKGDDKHAAVSPSQAMSHVISSFYSDLGLPESEPSLKALYHSVLDGKRALLLMDNALDETQVLPLLPPDSCVLLVTSRQHFSLPGLFAKNIDTLAPADARHFLLKVTPRIGIYADDIARLCGYLPLALRLAANALAKRVSLPPVNYLAQLSKEQERLKLIDASINLSYKMLSPEMQKLWRALSVFRETFVISMVAELWELEPEAAQNALDEMVSYSLVEWHDNVGFYRLHDLVRVFAYAQLSEHERDTAWKRRTERLTKESFRQQSQKIIEGYDPREQEAVHYVEWLRKKIYDAYLERANNEKRKVHPAMDNLENVWGAFTELLIYYRKYRSFMSSKITGLRWSQVQEIYVSLMQQGTVTALPPGLDLERVTEQIISYKNTIEKTRTVEGTLQLLENFFGLVSDLTPGFDLVGNIEIFERKFESALELVLTAIALAKEHIKEDYNDSLGT